MTELALGGRAFSHLFRRLDDCLAAQRGRAQRAQLRVVPFGVAQGEDRLGYAAGMINAER